MRKLLVKLSGKSRKFRDFEMFEQKNVTNIRHQN